MVSPTFRANVRQLLREDSSDKASHGDLLHLSRRLWRIASERPGPREVVAMNLLCPHCRNTLNLDVGTVPEEILCPVCGSSFRLEPGPTTEALAKEPGRRYATARELANDLRRWLNGEPIQARPVGAWERGWRWVERQPAVAGLLLTSGMAALAVVGAVVAWVFGEQVEAQRQRAQAALDKANFYQY